MWHCEAFRMLRSKFGQVFGVVILLTVILTMMVFLQQGFTIQIVNTRMLNGQQGVAQEGGKPVLMHVLTGTPRPQNRHLIPGAPPVPKDTPKFPRKPKPPATTKKPVIIEKNPVPDRATLGKMSDKDVASFYHSYVMSPQSTCSTVIRMGMVKDGGWEMCDDPRFKPDHKNCLVYSFGINFDFSYDDDMAEYGCEIHSFDPSMKNTRDHLRGKRVHFHATGISGSDGFIPGKGGLSQKQWPVFTLRSHRKRLNHTIPQRRIDIVKMDVEGSELTSLETAIRDGSLKDVRQLSWETHLSLNGNPPRHRYVEYINLMRGLYDAGFRIYLTSRNHVWSSFMSPMVHKQRVTCHEINMVNVNIVNNDDSNNNNNNNNSKNKIINNNNKVDIKINNINSDNNKKQQQTKHVR